MRKLFFIILMVWIMVILNLSLFLVNSQDVIPGKIEDLALTKTDLEMTNFFPKEFRLGDMQFNIQIKNNQNESLENIAAFVSGRGYSTYDVIPIELLGPGDKSYIIVFGNLKEAGDVRLAIRINNNVFYQNISVINIEEQQRKIDEIENEKIKKELLMNLSRGLDDIKQKFDLLEDKLIEKKGYSYDVSQINLAELKKYIRAAQSDILAEDTINAKINLNLALEEYTDQKTKLDNTEVISLVDRLRENAVIFTAIAGAFIMIFTLYELLKRQSVAVVSRFKNVKKEEKKKK